MRRLQPPIAGISSPRRWAGRDEVRGFSLPFRCHELATSHGLRSGLRRLNSNSENQEHERLKRFQKPPRFVLTPERRKITDEIRRLAEIEKPEMIAEGRRDKAAAQALTAHLIRAMTLKPRFSLNAAPISAEFVNGLESHTHKSRKARQTSLRQPTGHRSENGPARQSQRHGFNFRDEATSVADQESRNHFEHGVT